MPITDQRSQRKKDMIHTCENRLPPEEAVRAERVKGAMMRGVTREREALRNCRVFVSFGFWARWRTNPNVD
jgi:hypothetical protein